MTPSRSSSTTRWRAIGATSINWNTEEPDGTGHAQDDERERRQIEMGKWALTKQVYRIGYPRGHQPDQHDENLATVDMGGPEERRQQED